ncbi:MAG: hypothetical protein PVH61_44680 [Candidatus Aminicenantes bacterium]|jgi:hypothetical protein
MTTMLSLILAFMLTMGGSPAVSVSPVNSIGPESGVSHDITGKPRLGEFQKNYPVVAKPNAGNPRLVLNLSFQYKKPPLINLNQAFGMNPVNFTDPFGNVIKAEYGKHDMFKTKEVKTGKWYLDYTVVGAFNELRNAAALGINLVSNLFGTSEDIAFDVGDYGLSKVGIIERGELRDDPHMRNLFNAIMLTNPEAIESGTRTLISKLDDLTYSLYRLVKSKGGKVLDVRGNIIVSSGSEVSADELLRAFGGNEKYGGPVKIINKGGTELDDIGVPSWKIYERKFGGIQTPMETTFEGKIIKVRLDKPPIGSKIIDFKDYNWNKSAYTKPFIRKRVIEEFSSQIKKYKTIRPDVHLQFSQQPPSWVVEAIKEAGGTYSVIQ